MQTLSLKEANELINNSFSDFFHIYDVLFFKNRDWEDELIIQEKVYELIQEVTDIEHATGIARLEAEIFNKEELIQWLHQDRANMVLNYSRDLPDDMFKVLDEKIKELYSDIDLINERIELLRTQTFIELE